jgi:hypothetical protein
MVIRNCRFAQARELIRLEFDGLHRWCCNRSLRDITYENCEIGELIRAGELWGDVNEKVTCRFKNVRISCRKGYENEPLFIAGNFEKIIFEDCVIEGYTEPTILAGTDGEVEVIHSTPVTVKRASLEECIEKHPWGVVAEDRARGRTFKLTPLGQRRAVLVRKFYSFQEWHDLWIMPFLFQVNYTIKCNR